MFSNAGLPAVQTLASSLRGIQADVGSVGVTILKMDKTGCWVFGADQTEVEDDSLWAVNPFSFVHGYIAWGDGEVLAEKMAPVQQPLPEIEAAPPGAAKGWETQIGCSLKCASGDDTGLEARFTTTSVGGKKAITELGIAIAAQIELDQTKPVPLVQLKTEHYQHKKFGKIYTPLLKVKEWVSMTGEVETPEPAPAAIEPPARRRRAS